MYIYICIYTELHRRYKILQYTYLYIYIFIYISIYPSIHASIHLSNLSMYLMKQSPLSLRYPPFENQLHLLDASLCNIVLVPDFPQSYGGFHKWGYPNSWMVYLMDNPSTNG